MRDLLNVAPWDRLLRILIGGGVLAVGWFGFAPGIWGAACQLFGWFPLVTGIAGWCPFYVLLGVRTRHHGMHHYGAPSRHH
ncbi:MAG: DUF2892 domain-containing protein [Acidobacteriota bacterium]|jgi:hypothetical protein